MRRAELLVIERRVERAATSGDASWQVIAVDWDWSRVLAESERRVRAGEYVRVSQWPSGIFLLDPWIDHPEGRLPAADERCNRPLVRWERRRPGEREEYNCLMVPWTPDERRERLLEIAEEIMNDAVDT